MQLSKVKIIKKFTFFVLICGFCIGAVNYKDSGTELFYKQLATKQFIQDKESFLAKAKHDGVDEKTGKDIYTIGFGTRAKQGQTIDYNKASIDFNNYLNAHVWPELDPNLPINKYVAYGSFIYSTSFGHQPTSCEDILIRKYQMPGTKYKKGLIKRRNLEYKLCKEVIK